MVTIKIIFGIVFAYNIIILIRVWLETMQYF